MTVHINNMRRRRRRISAKVDDKEDRRQLQHLSISQSVITINNNNKRRRISAKEKETYTQQYLSNMFSHDIMLDILSRLPAKSLMRFRSVSKSWNYLIRKDHFFINMHLSRTKLQHEKIILTDYSLYSLDYNQGSNRLEQLIRPSSRLRQIIYRGHSFIWGSCNGLICTGGYLKKPLYIINPSTSEYRKLPYFNRRPDYSCYGFGYNPNTNDYVVVRLTLRKKLFLSAVYATTHGKKFKTSLTMSPN
ncbi:hypothetical protein FRX31_029925 [Thalictrum thalictroides]|uniref:F-box domain-containing protein n=1 Tax=Thalictrum thalictroides TaxID=46969 RepID=A0A7J6V771_THATH|nr:hypothetical protein FRX31_029925 [Thalictrum thalictroides]